MAARPKNAGGGSAAGIVLMALAALVFTGLGLAAAGRLLTGRWPFGGDYVPAVLTEPAPPAVPAAAAATLAYPVRIDLAEGDSALLRGTQNLGDTPLELFLPAGRHELTLRRLGYADQTFDLDVQGPMALTLRHQRFASPWRCVAVYPSGHQPKSVNYTPDGRYLLVALLDDDGFDAIDLAAGTVARYGPPDLAKYHGFVETLVSPDTGTFWLSQMTTGRVFEFGLPGPADPAPALRRVLDARGSWTKVLARDPAGRFLAVANWITSNVAVLDAETGELVADLTGLETPRGLAFSPDGALLYVASYEGAAVFRYSTADWRRTASYRGTAGSAFRHIVLSADGSTAYVSDMHGRRVVVLSAAGLEPIAELATDFNPNTIALSPDGRRLFVSCRGPNNPESYLLRSPRDGLVYVFNLATALTEAVLDGGNQPTGLAVAPDGASFAFTSFLDDRVEVYAYDSALR